MIGTGNKIFKTAKKEYQRKYFLHIAAMKYYVKVKLSTIINVIYFCGSDSLSFGEGWGEVSKTTHSTPHQFY